MEASSTKPSLTLSVERELYHELDTDKYYLYTNGCKHLTNGVGRPPVQFRPYCSGEASSIRRFRSAAHLVGLHSPSPIPVVNTASKGESPPPRDGHAQFPSPLSHVFYNLQPRAGMHIGKVLRKNTQLPHLPANPARESLPPSSGAVADVRSFVTSPSLLDSAISKPGRPAQRHSDVTGEAVARLHAEDSRISLDSVKSFGGERMLGYSIKRRYLPAIKETFMLHTKGSQKSCGNKKAAAVGRINEAEEDEVEGQKALRTYDAIQADLKRQEREYSLVFPSSLPKKLKFSAMVYDVHPTSEIELSRRAEDLRHRANPGVFEQLQRHEMRDKQLVIKRHQQTKLKRIAMESYIRKRERQLADERVKAATAAAGY